MRAYFCASAALLATAFPACAQEVSTVAASSPGAPTLPEDLFNLPPGAWTFAKQLWSGREACTKDACEAGYTSGDLVISVERGKKDVRIVAGFRNCASVAWNELYVGTSASKSDNKQIAKRLKTVVETSAKYCKVNAPSVPPLNAYQLFPSKAEGK